MSYCDSTNEVDNLISSSGSTEVYDVCLTNTDHTAYVLLKSNPSDNVKEIMKNEIKKSEKIFYVGFSTTEGIGILYYDPTRYRLRRYLRAPIVQNEEDVITEALIKDHYIILDLPKPRQILHRLISTIANLGKW